MTSAGPVIALLREKTGETHRRLETRMDAIERLSRPAQRDDLVRRYHRYHAALEAAMGPGLASIDAGDWRRTPLIEESLDRLGLAPLPPHELAPLDRLQAIGALYVLEGSALGGRVILKDLARRGADRRGLEFLDPHGETIAARWQAVVGLVECEAAGSDKVVEGAAFAFAHAHHILCVERVAA